MKPRQRSALALALLVLFGVPAAGGAGDPDLPDPRDRSLSGSERLEALVERVKLEQSRIETLEASFVQRQESSMLVEPDVSQGVFSYSAPDSVRWEYLRPKPISVVIDGEDMVTWYRDLGRAERLKVGRYSNHVLKYLGASASFQSLIDYFRITVTFPDDTSEPYRLELAPRYERIARRLRSMTVWVDPQRYLPVRLRYVAADGDVTDYRFEDLKVNQGMPRDRFRLDLPAGVEVRDTALGRQGR
jgi:outer membrane lipoprotein-sorting protein